MEYENYIVVNAADRMLCESVEKHSYDFTIQSGCANTKKRIADFSDDIGENISGKNPCFSELTALYWVWKHRKAHYIGWSHYRRRFQLSEEEIKYWILQEVDVILPKKLEIYEEMSKQYIWAHTLDSWKIMLEELQIRYPEYYDFAMKTGYFEQNQMYAFCMAIYRYDRFDQYCSWLFPLLKGIYERVGQKKDPYQNRYIAFLAERLHGLFFLYHEQDLIIVEAPVRIYNSVPDEESLNEETLESVSKRLEEYIKEYRVHDAYVYLSELKSGYKIAANKQIILWLEMISMCFFELRFSNQSALDYTKELSEMIVHYETIKRFMEQAIQTKELCADFKNYLHETKTTYYALMYVLSLYTEEYKKNSETIREKIGVLYHSS